MLISPPSRNALVDRDLPQLADGKWPGSTDGCNCADPKGGCPAARGARGALGQSCLWFSQGCTIGCAKCTGQNGHTTKSLCGSTMKPTINDPKLRTMNIHAAAGSVNDSYMYNPWRAPGSAPVEDACGMAGGTLPAHAGAGEAKFMATSIAKQGDLGSKVLKPMPTGVVWTAGETAEVSWGIRYNHGGGYQYRLCPAGEELTEACFQKTPLAWAGDEFRLRWNNGTERAFKGTYASEGVQPPGSVWARNPIPRIDPDGGGSGHSPREANCHGPAAVGLGCRNFDPVCEEGNWSEAGEWRPWHKIEPTARAGDVEGYCAGDWTGGQIVDRVVVPADLPPGDYVLGWRWDCEETSQVWASCADVTVCAPGSDCRTPPPMTPPPTPKPTESPLAGVWQPNTNYDGQDIIPVGCGHRGPGPGCTLNATATRTDCEAMCRATAGCVVYTFGNASCANNHGGATCYTKGGISTDVRGNNCFGSEIIKKQ